MKTLFKRLICLVVVVAVCLSSMHLMYSFATEPQLSSKCETVIELNGKETTFGEKASDLRTNSKIKFSAAKNLSAADIIELNVYVENAEALKNTLSVAETQALWLGFSSHALKENFTHSDADISAQITKDGWNTVKVKISDFSSGANWNQIRWVFLRFADENLEIDAALKNTVVKYKNVCDSFGVPEVTNGDEVFYDDSVIGTLGEDENALIADVEERVAVSFDEVDASETDVFKLDLFIYDFAAFEAFAAVNAPKISLVSEDGKAYTTKALNYTSASMPNWYTVTFAKNGLSEEGDFEIDAVTGIAFGFDVADNATVGANYNLKIGFANLRGFTYAATENSVNYGKEIATVSDGKIVVIFEKKLGGFETTIPGSYNAIGDAENIEFDLYVDNYTNFKNLFAFDKNNQAINASFDIKFVKGGKSLAFKGIEKQVVANGWNHIILSVADAQNGGFDLNAKFDEITAYVSGVNNDVLAGSPDEIAIISNVCATKGVATEGKLTYNEMANISEGKVAALGATFADSAITENVTAVNIDGAKFIEFDIYVQNFVALNSYIAEKGITDLTVTLSSSGTDFAKDSVTASILGLITKEGWNHLAVSYARFAKGEATGEFDATALNAVKIGFAGDLSASTGAFKGLKLAVNNIAACEVEDPKLPQNAKAVISEEGKSGVYGDKYNWLVDNSRITLASPVDASVGGILEFDFYVENYDAFKKMLEGSDKPLYFGLGTSEDKNSRRAIYKFADQVTGDGWNHIKLSTLSYATGIGDATPNMSSVYYVFLTFWSEADANAYSTQKFKFMNVCITPAEYEEVPTPPAYDVAVTLDGVKHTWGEQFVWIQDRATMTFSEPVNIDGVDKIEFDIYIENYENYLKMLENASEPLYLCINTKENKYQGRALFNIEERITHAGWNHVVIRTKDAIAKWGDTLNMSTVYGFRLHFGNASGSNPCVNDIVRIANIVGSYAEHTKLPALPENVIAQLGSETDGTNCVGNTVGDYFHYTLDRIYRQRMEPVDFSLSPVIELDVYIDDYEMFLAAQNDPNDGQNSKLAFVVSSTPPELWDQYSAPRAYYNARIPLEPYITHQGWNHISVGKAEFETVNHGVDWSAVTAYYIYYAGSSNFYPYQNANSKLYVKVANVVNTGVIANIPADKDKALKTDKNAVYISSVEGMSDDNGSWNTQIGDINTKYKTEGKASLTQKNTYLDNTENAKMYYLFDETADMSDLKTLKFDFFIDLPQYLSTPNNKIEVLVGNNRFANEDYYSWNMKLDNLKQGWNEVSLDLKDAKTVGNPDLKEAKVVMLRFTKIGLDASAFAEIVYGIDNLRYISATGNKILRVPGWDENLEDEEEIIEDEIVEDEIIIEDVEIIEDEDVDEVQKIETIVNKTGDVKYNKIVEKNVITDWLVAGIVVGIEAVVLAAAVVVFILIHRKKNKIK